MAKDLRGIVRCPTELPEFQPLLLEVCKENSFIPSLTQQILTEYLDSDLDRHRPSLIMQK